MADDFELDPDWALVPDDGLGVDADVALADAFRADPLDPSEDPTTVPAAPLPMGRTLAFDPINKSFVSFNGEPAVVSGVDTIKQWIVCLMYTARDAHPIFDEDYGIDNPWELIGSPDSDMSNQEYARMVTEAILEHDRITDVTNWTFAHDPMTDYTIVRFVVQIDGLDDDLPVEVPLNV